MPKRGLALAHGVLNFFPEVVPLLARLTHRTFWLDLVGSEEWHIAERFCRSQP
jgi:hypothetical protein